MLNLVISCGENTKNTNNDKVTCENISCGEYGECKIADKKAICECNIGYHSENLNCVRNKLTIDTVKLACEKIVPCKTGQEEDVDLCTVKYNSFYHSEPGGIYAYYMPVGERVNDYILCINSKNSCEDYNICFDEFMGITYSNEDCDNNSESCSGNKTLKVCENGKYKYTDCSAINKNCLEYGNNKAFCTNDTLCDENNFEIYCNENGSLVYCKNGVTQEYYCPYYGMECRADNNAPNCYLKEEAESCEENNKMWCEDGNMVLCKDNKKRITSCSLFGDNFKCMSLSYKSGDFTKNAHGCFYE